MMTSKRIVYRGHVQGVGFRYTVQRLAQEFPIGGYVRNLADGTVEMVVEGDQDFVHRFLGTVAEQMANYIVNHSESESPPEGLDAFEIRH